MTWEHVLTADAHDGTVFDYVSNSAYVTRSTTYKRTGTYSFKLQGSSINDATVRLAVASNATKYVAFAIASTSTENEGYFFLKEGSTVHIRLHLDADSSTIYVHRGNGTTLLGTITGYTPLTMRLLDMYFYIHDSSGRVVIHDSSGASLFDFTGDTRNGGSGTITTLEWQAQSNVTDTHIMYLDDIAVRTDDYCGPGGNYALAVTADGDNTAWTASAGSDYQCVDEIPATFTDYISADASTTGTKENLAVADIPIAVASVDVVAVYALAKLDAAGSGNIRATVKSGTSYGNGASIALDTSAVWVKDFFSVDPDTAAAWTESGINAMQPGVETI